MLYWLIWRKERTSEVLGSHLENCCPSSLVLSPFQSYCSLFLEFHSYMLDLMYWYSITLNFPFYFTTFNPFVILSRTVLQFEFLLIDPLHDMDCNIIHVWSLGAFWFFFPTECLLTTSRMRVLVNMVSTNRVPMKCWVTHILDVDKVAALLLAVSILTLDYQPQIFHKHILCPTSYFWIRTIGDQVTEINLDDTL